MNKKRKYNKLKFQVNEIKQAVTQKLKKVQWSQRINNLHYAEINNKDTDKE